MKRSTLLHLRIPFSFFLLPVFLFAWSISEVSSYFHLISVFVILHLFLYPASNGYNSYFDKDEQSIGGLKHPPKVSKELYYVSLIFDLIALIWGLVIGWEFCLMLFIYGLVSKAYSHPAIRLKKMPYTGWLAAGIFQGYFTFLMVFMGINEVSLTDLWQDYIQIPAILSTMLLFGSYPMTQVYQHEEDSSRGDITISLKLGILGTFHFTAAAFAVSGSGFLLYYLNFFSLEYALVFAAFVLPVLFYFISWYLKVRKDRKQADFGHTMRLNFLSAGLFNLFFAGVILFGS